MELAYDDAHIEEVTDKMKLVEADAHLPGGSQLTPLGAAALNRTLEDELTGRPTALERIAVSWLPKDGNIA